MSSGAKAGPGPPRRMAARPSRLRGFRYRRGRSRPVPPSSAAATARRQAAASASWICTSIPRFGLDGLDRFDLRRRGEPFGQQEAGGEIGEVGGRPHHHRLRRSVAAQRDRGLFRQRMLALRAVPSASNAVLRLWRQLFIPATQPPEERAATPPNAPNSPPASRSGRSTAKPARRSPCIPDNWSPSPNCRW